MDVWQPAVMLLPCVSSADCQSDKTDKMPENTTFTVLMGDGNDILLFFCLFFFLFLLCQLGMCCCLLRRLMELQKP